MPPKGFMKGKAKAKGKGKAKAKGKAKGKAKAKAKAVQEQQEVVEQPEVAEGEVAEGEGALVEVKPKAKGKGKASGLRKKILEEIGETSLEEALAEAKQVIATADAKIAEAAALEEAQDAQAKAAQEEFEQARAEVEAAIAKEAEATERHRKLKEKRQEAVDKEDLERRRLLEAQKKLAMMEVMAVNKKKMQELEEKRKAATEAAETAKRNLQEQRQREKDALEATRRALDEARALKAQAAKGAGRGAKRLSGGGDVPAAKRTAPADEQDTVPATLVDGDNLNEATGCIGCFAAVFTVEMTKVTTTLAYLTDLTTRFGRLPSLRRKARIPGGVRTCDVAGAHLAAGYTEGTR
eukprot:CAMPEP_0175500222 /NCGR_PEP_ID=MMETSP0096-20121207/6212_1 /TAXON_ID=311494 /ORGANISM="Alexandrium monilatum, Strain CCMP3105" /LENGTH=351 /DNA_ID=CAMNT_0016802261 /DNA_START=60 /DNA_END=1113 /DNA_ORIENTATION=+